MLENRRDFKFKEKTLESFLHSYTQKRLRAPRFASTSSTSLTTSTLGTSLSG